MKVISRLKSRKLKNYILAADIAWIPVALLAALFLHHGIGGRPGFWLTYINFSLAASALWAILFSYMLLDGFQMGWYMPAVASQLILGIVTLIFLILAVDDLTRIYISRLVLFYFGGFLFVGFVVVRRAVHAFLRSPYLEWAVRRVMIVGSGPVAREIAAKFSRHPEMLCRVAGFLCTEDAGLDFQSSQPSSASEAVSSVGVIDLIKSRQIDEVIITLPKMDTDVMNLAARCRIEGVRVSVVPTPYELYLSKPQLVDMGGLPVLQLHQANAAFADSVWKRTLDLTLGTVLFLLTWPAMLLGVILFRNRPGGGLVRDLRFGRHGEEFWMYRLNSERDRQGMGRLESMMHRLSITELPQIINVLRGEMSLVGPRPETPERVMRYSDWQRQRLSVKPGLTGMAQVHGLREDNSSEEKTRYDLQYLLNCSPVLDLSLLMQTAWTLIMRFIRLQGLVREEPEVAAKAAIDRIFEPTTYAHRTQSSTN